MNSAPPMRIFATAFVLTLPSCMPVAFASTRSICANPFCVPETLCEFRRRIDEALMDELIAIQAAAAMEEGLVSPAHLVIDTFRVNKGVSASQMPPRCTRDKKTLSASHISPNLQPPGDATHQPSPQPPAGVTKGHAELWTPVPGARQGLCETGPRNRTAIPGARTAHPKPGAAGPAGAGTDDDAARATRERFASALDAALDTHAAHPRPIYTAHPGQKLRHCKIVNAYDPTIAPILKGKSNCPAQFGRKPGIVSEPATGFILANRVPKGNPNDLSYVLPLLDKVEQAIERVGPCHELHVYSVAGDLGVNDATLRQALHARGMLTVGIPKTVEPIQRQPSPAEVFDILNEAGLSASAHLIKSTWPVKVAIAVPVIPA